MANNISINVSKGEQEIIDRVIKFYGYKSKRILLMEYVRYLDKRISPEQSIPELKQEKKSLEAELTQKSKDIEEAQKRIAEIKKLEEKLDLIRQNNEFVGKKAHADTIINNIAWNLSKGNRKRAEELAEGNSEFVGISIKELILRAEGIENPINPII
jgi:hypothetical protein